MSGAKQIHAAELLRTKAIQKELEKDYDAALELHVKAVEAFLQLADVAKDSRSRSIYATAAGRSLDRVKEIKKVKTDVRPIAPDPYSSQVQQYILDKSSLINGIRYPAWDMSELHSNPRQSSGAVHSDPDGQPSLETIPQAESIVWLRPAMVLSRPLRMMDPTLSPEDVVQSVVTDCSVVAAISVCIQHGKKFGSKLMISSLYPQDVHGLPCLSTNGEYALRVFINGAQRKVSKSFEQLSLADALLIDDTLPFFEDKQFVGVSTGRNQALWPPLIEKAYMKLMGGYNFPGSNSGVDLHVLIGWIPEHVLIRSSQFRKEGTWMRIFKGYTKGLDYPTGAVTQVNSSHSGLCLATLGTPSVIPESMNVNLLPAHNYAVIDLEDDEEDQYITLLDPWCQSTSESRLPEMKSCEFDPKLRLNWREIYTYFDTIHLSWDPNIFSKVYYNLDNRVLTDLKIQKRVVLSPADNLITVISSLEKGDVDMRYTIAVYSDVEVAAEPSGQIGPYSKTVGLPIFKEANPSLPRRTSGGNHTYPTFMNNPQYRLTIHPKGSINNNAPTSLYFSVQGSKDLALNVKIAWSGGERLVIPGKGDILADSGAYSYGIAYGEQLLKPGKYTLIVSTFEPRHQGEYEINLQSSSPLDIEPLPMEGVGMYPATLRGTWRQDMAAGPKGSARYFSNPLLKVSIPTSMTIMYLQGTFAATGG
ncbi:hypothetical protein Clacol_002646 [Clathrus columnatus]|uniref:Calpain catalytic domain-containing protein n=1 Tax=Clathrus columnatus TaxID=1419009 RepID=A0AAV5A2F7_9AGAM|nr:hypothetical protein Clacol_002646 [Clathrus columnatus]